MKSNILSLALLASSLALSPCAASAQPADSAKGRHLERMFADLNLTADQKTKLKALHQELKGSHKQVFDEMKALREKTKAELQKPQPSKQLLDGYAVQTGDVHKQLAQKRTAHMLQIKAILTPEQFTKLLNREPRRQAIKRGHKGKRGCDGYGPDDADGEM
jgi:Spy/CpxP family protein refolding chaperone